jgi:hypothetical protein
MHSHLGAVRGLDGDCDAVELRLQADRPAAPGGSAGARRNQPVGVEQTNEPLPLL